GLRGGRVCDCVHKFPELSRIRILATNEHEFSRIYTGCWVRRLFTPLFPFVKIRVHSWLKFLFLNSMEFKTCSHGANLDLAVVENCRMRITRKFRELIIIQ